MYIRLIRVSQISQTKYTIIALQGTISRYILYMSYKAISINIVQYTRDYVQESNRLIPKIRFNVRSIEQCILITGNEYIFKKKI